MQGVHASALSILASNTVNPKAVATPNLIECANKILPFF
jgi:hypothetical protein